MLAVKALTVKYGPVVAVRDVTLNVAPGESVAVIGSNGAGKTSLLGAIAGLITPARGELFLDGRDLASDTSLARLSMGITLVPEGRHVFPYMNVETNLLCGAYWRRRTCSRRELLAETEAIYSYFPKLAERRRQLAGTLSGGEQQMLVLGRALMSGPRILLLDEPSLGLAPMVVDQVFEILGRLREDRGLAICLVEQEAQKALSFCSRGYVIADGRVVLEAPSEVLADSNLVQEIYLGMERT